jgi:radical SAM protein with 4Fe4S-binding SPASM domain
MRVFNKRFINYHIRWFQRKVLNNYSLKFPESIQIQTISRCNGRCNFCPYPEVSDTLTHGLIEERVFRGIIDELSRHRISVIYPYLMNEPFLDKDIFDKVSYIKKKMSYVPVVLNTNGLLLTEDRIDTMISSPLDNLVISLNTVDKESYKKMMGIDADQIQANIDKLLLRLQESNSKITVMISVIRTADNESYLDEIFEYCRKRRMKFFVNDVENRGGNLSSYESIKPSASIKRKGIRSCIRPLVQAYVLYNADMVLCCADWRRQIILGNVLKDGGIEAVWNSDRAKTIRQTIRKQQFHKISICGPCTFKYQCNI